MNKDTKGPLRTTLFSLFLLLLIPYLAYGKKELTLREAVEKAIKANPQVSTAIKQKEEFSFQKNIIRAEFFPKLYLNYSFERRDLGKGAPTVDTSLLGPALTWNIFSGFSTYYSYREALYYISAQDEQIKTKILEIALAVTRVYLDYFKQKALLEAALADLEDAKLLVKLAQKRYEVGLSPYADVLDAEARLKEAEYKVTNYKYSADIAKARAILLLNEDLTALENYEFLPLKEDELKIRSFSELIEKAKKLRPELNFKEKEILAQEERIKSVKGEYYPSIDLFTSYYKTDKSLFPDRDYQFLAGFKITFPLFTGLSTPSKLQKERATLERKALEKRSLELQIQEEVFIVYNNFLTFQENLSSAQALLTKMEEDYKIMKKKYENGLASIVDVTTVLARLSQARSQVAVSKYDLMYNYFSIQKTVGEIPGL